jgi:iron complex outermembrane recepter protein
MVEIGEGLNRFGEVMGIAPGSISSKLTASALDHASLEQSVSVNIDGIQVGRGNIVSRGFFDLWQVEAMKGPQALFFGKNSPAGVISLHSTDPTGTLSGYVRTGYEFVANERYGEAAIGGAAH